MLGVEILCWQNKHDPGEIPTPEPWDVGSSVLVTVTIIAGQHSMKLSQID